MSKVPLDRSVIRATLGNTYPVCGQWPNAPAVGLVLEPTGVPRSSETGPPLGPPQDPRYR